MTIFDSKRDWHAYAARVKALPQDYQVVYHAIEKYLYKVDSFSTTNLPDPDVFEAILTVFEQGAAEDKDVLAITGSDVAAFVDGMHSA